MKSQLSLSELYTQPTPEALWQLRGDLLATGLPEHARAMTVLDHFYQFLNELVASSTARQYSHFASLLDMAAVAGVALENLIGQKDSEEWWKSFALGAVSEAMMVLAARQYVKAWEEEMKASYHSAAWYLSQEYWSLSAELRPDLPAEARQRLIEDLVAPIQAHDVEGMVKAGLIVRLFQLLLFARLRFGNLLAGD